VSKNTIAIIQARMGSTRLPGKVLMDIMGKPVLWHIVNRLKRSQRIDKIIVATGAGSSDDVIESFCDANSLNIFRGSESDVLERFYNAALHFNAQTIVRITGDCPLIDPDIVDKVVAGYGNGEYDYYSLAGKFPDGLDCEVFSFAALKKAFNNSKLPSEREHVTPYIYNNPEKFKIGGLHLFDNHHHLRWTVDEPSDYQLVKKIYDYLWKDDKIFLTDQILDLFNRFPELKKINGNHTRNAGYLKSLGSDNTKKA
jgi:spore coat polysaccharide biosynthesis protein SpsF